MKLLKFFALFGLSLIMSIQGYSQGSTKPYTNSSSGEFYSQMWKDGSNYNGTATAANLGTQKDTTTGVTPYYLSICRFGEYGVADTFTLAPLMGYGVMRFTFAAYQVIASDVATATLQESSDGIIWSTVTEVTGAISITANSTTVPVVVQWILPIKYSRYYRIMYVGTSAKSSFIQAWCYKSNGK